ncbi:hypothetical protein KW790_01480 [Candidatus Parcubacteria bacterium]|nr:hypothetical protein [Candidatus Parcubacteria bacterium]
MKKLKKKEKNKEKKRLVLLDSHAIIHRAYHALPDFSTSQGEPTGALFGLSTMLIALIEELEPEYIVAAFDLAGPTHRHEVYEAYKGTRKKIDENLITQINRAKDLFKAWGIPVYSFKGFEADDVLGTVVEETKGDKNLEIIIASGDMDTMQLIDDDRVKVYTLRKGIKDTVLYNEKKVIERFGFKPELLPDWKGLRGDPSDNIIGVKGIGEKTATSLVQTFGTVENIYKNLKKKDDTWKKAGITERIKNLLLENEEEALFSKTLATIRRDAPIDFKLPDSWTKCMSIDKVLDLYKELEFRTMGERVKMLLTGSMPKDIEKDLSEVSSDYADDPELKLALWVVDSNYTNPNMDDVFTFTKKKTIEDAWEVINKELDKRNSRKVFEEIERPLVPVVEEMHNIGIKIDRKFLKELSEKYHKELDRLQAEIWKHAGEEFNINSPKQLGGIIFEKLLLGGSRQKKTATGGFTTKESELEKLKDKHPIIGCILDYRELAKLLGTYIDAIPPLLDANDRLHSTFILAGSTTGRMASENPGIQNIPIRTSLGRAIRSAFIAEKGKCLLSLDYSQVELRIAAMLSEDSKLVQIFKEGTDIHTGVAARIFKVRPEEITKDMRARAKTINFGILYGMGVTALTANLKTNRKEAQEFYNNYFETFKELAEYLDGVRAEAEARGYTETMFGRRRYFSGFRSPLPYIKAQAERMAVNAPIQGTEADIVKIAMKKIFDKIKEKNWNGKVSMVLQVHDEIVLEVEDDLAKEVGEASREIMESIIPEEKRKGVPLVAEFSYGKTWGDSN